MEKIRKIGNYSLYLAVVFGGLWWYGLPYFPEFLWVSALFSMVSIIAYLAPNFVYSIEN